MKYEIKYSSFIDFSVPNEIGGLLIFKNEMYDAKIKRQWHTLVNISKIIFIYITNQTGFLVYLKTVKMPCNTHILSNVPPGYKIIEIPRHLILGILG